MSHRKGRETKQQPSMLPGPAVPGCCLVYFHFLCDIHSIHSVGTILYVVFFEILPKAKEIGATGFQQVLAMVVGFGVFLPTLLLHKFHIA